MLVAVLVVCLALVGALVVLSLQLDRGSGDDPVEIERRFQALGDALGAPESSGTISLDMHGRSFELGLRRRGGKIVLEIETRGGSGSPASARLPVVVRRETSIDRLGKHLRINREVQTGDAAFDAAAYVESDASDADVERVLGAADVRRHAYALLEQGFSRVVLPTGAGPLVASRDPGGIGLEPEAVRAACLDLERAATAIPPPPEGARPPRLWLAGPLTAVVSAVLAFVGFYLFTWTREAHYPLVHGATTFGLGLGLLAWISSMPLVGALVRGRSGSFRMFGACFCLLLVGFPLAGAGLAAALNARMDEAEPVLHHARVLSKGSRSYKGSTSYYVRVDGFSERESELELPIERDVFTSVNEGEHVVVLVGRGRFGWSWLRGIRLRE